MRLIRFIFALAKVYLPIPLEFKTDVDDTQIDATKAYENWKSQGTDTMIGKFVNNVLEHWIFRTLLLFLIIPCGVKLQNIGKKKDEPSDISDAELENIIKKLDER